ncbi:uncharacterized protein A1O9_10620 [Exophiala aquamarina CBS 119918]|uniref:Transcription factor domain-containing protein n=1 Tax=Exophiala aquamarina CBS 119918 TaxID=1182545 RepID=A0A072P0F9_9EURO|nr:uncharacterized protein A1O9_10620 [Exophiala aquamarina CBS 119918]KEF53172.1 hypothetical protein A1O9_10620 [Exophiala aquamarina CBS 119918]
MEQPRSHLLHAQAFGSPESVPSFRSSYELMTSSTRNSKSQFEVETGPVPNFVATGVISLDQARLFFNAFFQGCDRYVPIFDPPHDTFESISNRSSLLFNAILTVGCGVMSDADSHLCNLLQFRLKKLLNLVIIIPEYASLETVQALLVTACYVSERSLLLAFATRMGLDLNLQTAYTELMSELVTRESQVQDVGVFAYKEREAELMRKSRAWFELLILEQILHVDAGNLRGFRFKGDARRCRVLLDKPFSTILDLRLLSQVELNSLRARVHDSISNGKFFADDEILDIVRDAQVDLSIWYQDWHQIMTRSQTAETPVLLLNLEVQRLWSVAMVLCNSVRAMGNDNIASMSPAQQDVLLMAKDALKKHLRITLDQPQYYLSNFRFAMDFVWAKCAFCFLLLLKLTRLLPEDDDAAKRKLLQDGYVLLGELNKVGGGSTSGGRTNTSKMYLQVLQLSIQKYGRALQNDQSQEENGVDIFQGPHSPVNFFWTSGNNLGQRELESFVPEQFVFEWDFPLLTLFSSPNVNDDIFGDLLTGSFGGSDPLFCGMIG